MMARCPVSGSIRSSGKLGLAGDGLAHHRSSLSMAKCSIPASLKVPPVDLLAHGHALLHAEHVMAQVECGAHLALAADAPYLVAHGGSHNARACHTLSGARCYTLRYAQRPERRAKIRFTH